jgi:hypothetical protein
VFTSVQSGLFSSNATWGASRAPSGTSDYVFITSPFVVSSSFTQSNCANLTVKSVLSFFLKQCFVCHFFCARFICLLPKGATLLFNNSNDAPVEVFVGLILEGGSLMCIKNSGSVCVVAFLSYFVEVTGNSPVVGAGPAFGSLKPFPAYPNVSSVIVGSDFSVSNTDLSFPLDPQGASRTITVQGDLGLSYLSTVASGAIVFSVTSPGARIVFRGSGVAGFAVDISLATVRTTQPMILSADLT